MRSFRPVAALAALLFPALSSAVTYVDIPVTDARDHAFDAAGNLYVTAGNKLLRYDTASCVLGATALGTSLYGVDASSDGRYLAVADLGLIGSNAHVYIYDAFGARTPRRLDYPAYSLESGSYMVAWAGANQLYISGSVAGSGWVPLRRFDVASNTLHSHGTVQQNTMLAPSRDGQWLALVESNISSGPVRLMNTSTQQYVASINMDWFGYEVAVNGNGTRVVSPSYNGAFVYDVANGAMTQVGLIGQYANNGPLSVVFSPDSSLIVTASFSFSTASQRGVRLYDATTRAFVMTLDPYAWTSSSGNRALQSGRLTISRDGRWLAATQTGRVRLYDVGAELGVAGLRGKTSCATLSIAPRRIASLTPASGASARDFDADGNAWRD